ncbi:hypothetical protein V2G26_016797 [Clonostachys chloroleuca]
MADVLTSPVDGHDRDGFHQNSFPLDRAATNSPAIAPEVATNPSQGPSPEVLKQVNDVLSSEIGITTLLNRLKASIATSKEFASFLKKRASLEESNAQGLKKVSRATQHSLRQPDHRQGSFSSAYDDIVQIHERMSENGSQFASSLLKMHDELVELVNSSEQSRKTWKTTGLSAEHKVAELEQTMRKSKAKYDSLSDEYDKIKTGEKQTGKVFNAFKNKSAAQQEEDLLKKVQNADQTYKSHVQTLQTEKHHLETSTRPEAVRALQDLIKDIDAGLSLQLQQYALLSEKLLLSNGLSVSPIPAPGADPSSVRSLRNAVLSIDNERDLNDYISAQSSKVPHVPGDVKYERNPVLGPGPSHAREPSNQGSINKAPLQSHPPQSSAGPPPPSGPPSKTNTGLNPINPPMGHPASLGKNPTNFTPTGPPNPPSFPPSHNRTFSQTDYGSNSGVQTSSGHPPPAYTPGSPVGPPQLGALPFQSSQAAAAQHERQGSHTSAGLKSASPGPIQTTSAPPKPVFGVHLSRLYERDGLAVPLVVHQCIQAADLYGLGVEGIYRQSGSLVHVQKLKHMFDTDSQNPALDFRNPENFYHDVNSVTGLLKQFLRDLPDPLLTSEHHDSFVAAAKHDDDVARRDSMHAIINSLPDPNYATLRALSLHLYRVMDNAHVNRMNSHNLAVIFGPTIMGTDPSNAIADAGWQIKVVDTILQNTYDIFDED